MSVVEPTASVVQLTISCKNLPDMDVFSKSDPMCAVFLKNPARQTWTEIGRTETVWNNLNPEFTKKILVTFAFEQYQMLRFEVYDIDSEDNDLTKHDFLGSLEVALGEIVASAGLKAFERPLIGDRGKGKHGSIKILAEEISSCREEFCFQLGAKDLPLRYFGLANVLGLNSYFFEIHKMTETNGYSLVYRSEKRKGNRAALWKQVTLNNFALCNGDADRSLKITVKLHRANGSHKKIGECDTTVRTLFDLITENTMPCTLKLKNRKYTSLQMYSLSKGSHSTFLDFIRLGGVEVHCFVAIDFTSSNGAPTHPNSLHYMHPTMPNQYQTALRSVLEILQDYDTNKLFPVLGFGAQVPPSWEVSHQFFVNMHPTNPYCPGVEGVMDAYAKALPVIRLHGPTNFAPIINHVSRFAAANRDGHDYFVLLIITDGQICDMPQTTDAIVAASGLPMSIIIVGVGSADFTSMDVLDADEEPLIDSNNRKMLRDIVQFVPFSEILRRANNNMAMAKVDLAREVLFEVPGQFLSYMKSIGATAEKLAAKPKPKPKPAEQSQPIDTLL